MSNRTKVFLGIPLSSQTQDIYLARTFIERALRGALPHFHGTFLDVGCGVQPYRELITSAPSRVERYIGLDLQTVEPGYGRVSPDITWDGLTIPMDDASVGSAMATEVLEHCPDPAGVLAEIHRVLHPGGVFFLTVPFLWPLHDVPYDEYRYTPFSMERLLKESGFAGIEVQPMGGWDASLAQMIGLYVMRAPMAHRKRRILRNLTLPLVRFLVGRDRQPDIMSNPMITGLWALARKN
jgi:SAM-dependent methyltransferase